MSRYSHDFQNENGKRSREDNFENPYTHQQLQNYRFDPSMTHDMRHNMNHSTMHLPHQHQPVYHDYDRMNIYSTIKQIEEKHFSEVKKLKDDIDNIDDIIHNLKDERVKNAKYIAEVEQKLAKEIILKEKYKNSEKNLMEKIVWLESSNSDMKSLLDKFSQQIPYSVCISPTNKAKEENSEQENSSESDKKQPSEEVK
jgi:chorismate mutase